jgi:3-mercaptopyruvate sulfurtransferase SseA
VVLLGVPLGVNHGQHTNKTQQTHPHPGKPESGLSSHDARSHDRSVLHRHQNNASAMLVDVRSPSRYGGLYQNRGDPVMASNRVNLSSTVRPEVKAKTEAIARRENNTTSLLSNKSSTPHA